MIREYKSEALTNFPPLDFDDQVASIDGVYRHRFNHFKLR